MWYQNLRVHFYWKLKIKWHIELKAVKSTNTKNQDFWQDSQTSMYTASFFFQILLSKLCNPSFKLKFLEIVAYPLS